jgi:protein-disulfide isomerase
MFDVQRRRRTGSSLLVPDHVAGNAWAPVIIVEYGTYCCPREIWTYPAVNAIQQSHPDQVAFVYRHFPLVRRYPSAVLAAEAAEAAAAQGQFWLMHGYLVGHPRPYCSADLARVAEELGLNADALALDLLERTHAGRVKEHFHCGIRDGVHRLPALFINGELYDGPPTPKAFTSVVLEALHALA